MNLHKGCNSSTCCSPAKLWRTLQTLVKNDDRKGLIHFFKDARLEHIVRAALTSRITNDASLYPRSQQHKVIRLTSREALLYLGKSYTDLNLLQLALLTSSESTVLAVLSLLKAHTTQAEMKHFVNHVWGQGNTSLHLAAFLKRHAVVKALLDLGCASDSQRNARNKYASDCCMGDSSILDLLQPKVEVIVIKKEVVEPPQPIVCIVEPEPMKDACPDVRKPDDLAVVRFYPACRDDFVIDKKILLSILVQPNQCIALAPLKKPPDILGNTILTC